MIERLAVISRKFGRKDSRGSLHSILNLIPVVHERIETGAYFSFNYNTLLLVASVVAALGLVSNSNASVIAR